jgi:autotransporter-associated beta strand protein
MKMIVKISLLLLAFFALPAQAGHLFTQASSNTATWIQAGSGISIDQVAMETSYGNGSISFNFEANPAVPAGANTANTDWWQWSAGDVLKFSVPSTTGDFSLILAYDTDTSCAYDVCGATNIGSLTQSVVGATTLTIGQASVSSSNPLVWTVEALAGEFSLGGYRISFSNGLLDGTGAGPLNQSSVVDSSELPAPGGSSTPDIDSGQQSYTVTELNNSSVNAVFDGGVLQVDSSGSVAAAFTVKATNGTIDSNANDVDFSGVFSGAGGITKSGSGTVTLSGVNTYSGGTTVSGGTLQVSSDANLGTGGLTLDGGTLESSSTMTTAKNIAVGASNGELNVASGTTFTSDGVVSGVGGITKSGNGTVTLSGVNTYTGVTTVNAGVLRVEGGLASTQVNIGSGGVLGGSGSLAGDVMVLGTVTPGSSPGTLTVAGDFTLTSGSTLATEVDGNNYSVVGGAGSYDRINLTGATSLFTADGTLEPILRGISAPATNSFTPAIGESFRIVTTANSAGVIGEFSSITQPLVGLDDSTRFDVAYGSNFIDLYVTPQSYSALLADRGPLNMVNAATAFDSIRPSSVTLSSTDTSQFFNGLHGLSVTQLSSALLQASGEIHVFALDDVRSSIQTMSTSLYSATRAASVGNDFWLDIGGNSASYESDEIASAYDSNEHHIWIGKHLIDNGSNHFGVAMGYSKGSVSTDINASTDRKTAALATYFHSGLDAIKVDGEIGIAHAWTDIDRMVGLSTGISENESTAKADVAFANVSLEYESILTDKVKGSLLTRLGVEFIDADGYVESGSSVSALQIKQEFYRSAEFGLGYRFDGSFSTEHGAAQWNLALGATKQLSWDDQTLERSISMHGADWAVSTADAGDVSKFLNVGAVLPLGTNSTIGINLNTTHASDESTFGGNLVFSIKL